MLLDFLAHTPQLGRDVFVAANAMIIGSVELADEVSIWYGCVVRGDVGKITIGARTNIQDLSVIHVTGGKHDTHIGHDVTVGHRVILHGCVVHEHVLVGMGAVLMDGVEVGPHSFIAAGSLLTPGKKIPPHSLVMGSPGRVVRQVSAEELATTARTVGLYVELARQHRLIGVGL